MPKVEIAAELFLNPADFTQHQIESIANAVMEFKEQFESDKDAMVAFRRQYMESPMAAVRTLYCIAQMKAVHRVLAGKQVRADFQGVREIDYEDDES